MRSSSLPTRQQRRVLDAITAHAAATGLTPTLQEVGDALGVNRVTVFEHCQKLREKGFLHGGRELLAMEHCPACGKKMKVK